MSDKNKDLHIKHAAYFIETLKNHNVSAFIISPGARSTPLALCALRSKIKVFTVIDERSAAFFALGVSRASGAPTVLICTSGTAGAHYLAAVMEAKKSFIPLIVVTADRPWENQDAGASQTAYQHNLFGEHVNSYHELGEPFDGSNKFAQSIAIKAVLTSSWPFKGPVHVNTRFRKPLHPLAEDSFLIRGNLLPEVKKIILSASVFRPDRQSILAVYSLIKKSKKPSLSRSP